MGVYLAHFLIMWKYAPKDNNDDNDGDYHELIEEETIHLNDHDNQRDATNNNSISTHHSLHSERSRSTARSVDEIRLRASFG